MLARSVARFCKVNAMDLASAPTIAVCKPAHPAAPADRARICILTASKARDSAFTEAWDALVAEATQPNPFLEPWFLLPSLDHFGGERVRLIARYEGERLAGIMPIERRTSYYGYPVPHLAGWLHDNSFCGGPLVARGSEHAFWRDLLAELDREPGLALFLHLPGLPADGALHAALEDVLAAEHRRAVTVQDEARAMLVSGLSPAAYLEASMSAKKRKELRRQHKRLSEEGELRFVRAKDADGSRLWIDQFLGLEAAGWKGDAGSALADAPETRAFFTSALAGAAEAGRLERLTLLLDGNPIAMLATFLTPPGAFGFKTTFDERYARFSPGLLLQIENLDILERQDIEWSDSCAAPGHSMIERIWREKRRLTTRNIAIGGRLWRAAFRALMAYETRGGPAS